MKEELKKWFQIDLDTIEEDKELFTNIQKAIEKLNDIEMANKYEVVLNNNLIEVKDKYTNFRTILGCRVSYDNLDKNVSFIVRADTKPSYENLEQQIVIMEKYFELITDLGYDYDGLNSVESLKGLIDELVRYANLGRVCNTTEPIYENGGKKYNILMEETK